MELFIAKLMFYIQQEEDAVTDQFDEQIRIIQAENYEMAVEKAQNLGRLEEISFLNSNQKQVQWVFIDVFDLYPLQEFKDGEQLYSVTHENQNAKNFIHYIRKTAEGLVQKNSALSIA